MAGFLEPAQPFFESGHQGTGPLEHLLQRKIERHRQGDHQPGDHQDERPGVTQGADQSLLEQRADIAATAPVCGAWHGGRSRAVQPVEGHQQAYEKQDNPDDAFEREGRQALHVAGHQPGAQHDQPDRQDVDAPAKALRQQPDPGSAQGAAFGGKQAEDGQ